MQELQARHKGGRGESPRTPLTLALELVWHFCFQCFANVLFSWISSFHSKEWTGPSITQINQKFNNFYAREIWGASNSNLRSGGPSLPGIEISEREERLIEYDRRLYHSYSTYPKHFRAFSKSLIPCSWLKETDKRIYKLHQLSLTQEEGIEGVKFPVRYSRIMAYTERLRPKEVRFSGFRHMKGYIFHLSKYRGRKICHLGR